MKKQCDLLTRIAFVRAVAAVISLLAALSAHASTTSVTGTVTDKETKAPIAGAIVRLHAIRSDYTSNGGYTFSALSDAKGHFVLTTLDSGLIATYRFYVMVCKTGYVEYPDRLNLRDACQRGLNGPLFGPYFKSRSAFEQALGIFEIKEGRVSKIAVSLQRGGGIDGQVQVKTAAGLAPFGNGQVLLEKTPDPDELNRTLTTEPVAITSATCDAGGHFSISGLYPSNNYTITLLPQGYAWASVEQVQVTAGQVTSISPIIDETDTTGVRGLVTAVASSAPDIVSETSSLGVVNVKPTAGDTALTMRRSCSVDIAADGSFACLGLAPGVYTIQAALSDGRTAARTVTVERAKTTVVNIEVSQS